MKDLEFLVAIKAKLETDRKIIISKKYHDLLDVFLKKALNIFSPHQKSYHKIILKDG